MNSRLAQLHNDDFIYTESIRPVRKRDIIINVYSKDLQELDTIDEIKIHFNKNEIVVDNELFSHMSPSYMAILWINFFLQIILIIIIFVK
jgi:hypothetical protein